MRHSSPSPCAETLFVISDLHLGGDDGFRMCSAGGRHRLAQFLHWLPSQAPEARQVHLVLAGDIFDFLAEAPFAAFTSDDAIAEQKLRRILDEPTITPILTALSALLAAGGRLTLMLGNHDVELSLPGPRRLLIERLGPGAIEFIDDNRAFTRGPVLIEHGNRYDDWNAVNHDALRQARSAISRREPVEPVTVPGSELVIRVMNHYKSRYPFIDLLQPTTEAVLPLLAVLQPAAIQEIRKLLPLWVRSRRRRRAGGVPVDPGLISAEVDRTSSLLRDIDPTSFDDDGNISASSTGSQWWNVWHATETAERSVWLKKVQAALKQQDDALIHAFDTTTESATYTEAANEHIRRGFSLVVFGHTHVAKRLHTKGGTYINTGTWADVMRVPVEVLAGTEEGLRALDDFLKGLEQNQIDPWRELLPTFARIEMNGEELISAELLAFTASGDAKRVPDGIVPKGFAD